MTGCRLLRAMQAQSRPHGPVDAKHCRKAKPCFAVLHLKSPGLRAWHKGSHHDRPCVLTIDAPSRSGACSPTDTRRLQLALAARSQMYKPQLQPAAAHHALWLPQPAGSIAITEPAALQVLKPGSCDPI